MTNEEILKLAREAGHPYPEADEQFLVDLAELFMAAERKECISDINAISQEYDERGMLHERQKCINVILARGVTKP